jgi:hypothetical protein
MSDSIVALPTLISPPFEPACERRLAGSVVARANLTLAERDEMYALLLAYFVGTSRAQFEADLAEKEAAILLRDVETSQIQGFSTLMRIATRVDAREIVAFFSGDTIVAQQYWGESELSRLWSRTVFAEADRILANTPGARVYWFLICSGYKTWRFLPVFFREFYPNADTPTPPHLKNILDALGARKFGDQYNPLTGVVRLRSATPLRSGVADVTEHRLRDPRIAFFTKMNPGHLLGDELACLTQISRSNLTRAGERMVGARIVSAREGQS